jgi:diacylglycerol kinase (ATP)
MPLRKLIKSTNYAIEGILHAVKTQRHIRYHFFTAIFILILSLILGIKQGEFVAICIVAMIVLCVEMLNTAIEATVDILFQEYDERAKIIKDISAGAVLTAAIGAAIIGYIIFLPYMKSSFEGGLSIAKRSGNDITKAFLGKGTPLRGGMPSGHAAVAFSVWTAVTFLTETFMPSFLILILAVLIAQSRVSVGAHKPWEVVLGALLGFTVTFFLFKIFSL